MATASWIKSLLDQRGVPYEELHHREVFTAQEVARSEHVSGHRLAKWWLCWPATAPGW